MILERSWWDPSRMRTFRYIHFLSKLGGKTRDKEQIHSTKKGKNHPGIHKHQNQHGRTAASTTYIPRHSINRKKFINGGRMPVIRTVRQSRTWDISNIKKDILCLKNLFLLLLLLGSVLIFEESFATSWPSPTVHIELEISNAPKLHEEFELTILVVPSDYNKKIGRRTKQRKITNGFHNSNSKKF